MNNKREGNYDLLRIVACIAVVMIHVATYFYQEYAKLGAAEITSQNQLISIALYYTIPRFAVPCFVMLSGAFVLDQKRTEDYKQFYKHTFEKVGIPTLVFSALYMIYGFLLATLRNDPDFNPGGINGRYADVWIKALKGEPFYHMWYLFMMIGVYLLAPVIYRFIKNCDQTALNKIAVFFLILASISYWTSSSMLKWDIGRSFEYCSYFLIGYCIRKSSQSDKKKAAIGIIGGVSAELISTWFSYLQLTHAADFHLEIVEPLTPFTVIASVPFFWGFAHLRFNRDVSGLSSETFYIYLFHAGILDVIVKILNKINGKNYLTQVNSAYMIPLLVIIVFLLAWLFSVIYQHITQLLKLYRIKANTGNKE